MSIRKTVKLLVFIIVGVIVFGVCFYNLISTSKEIQISNTTLEQISQINWNDEKLLLELGFEKGEGGYHFLNDDGYHFTNNYDVIYSLTISSLENEKDMNADLYKYKNILYKAEESKIGKLDIRRLWLKEIHVTRRYIVYVDDLEIYMREDNIEDSLNEFEKIINTIFTKAKSNS